MRNVILVCLAIMALATALWSESARRQTSRGLTTDRLLRQLGAKNVVERKRAYSRLLNQRKELIQELLKIAKAKKRKYYLFDERELAVMLLGEMRAPEAVETLFKEIDFRPPRIRLALSPYGAYPCAEALMKIGDPAVRYMLEEFKQIPQKEILTLHAYVMLVVEGNREVAILKIKKHLKHAVYGPTGREKYLRALLAECEKVSWADLYGY